MEWTEQRAVTPVIGIVLLVAVALLLATTVGMTVFTFTDDLREPAPNVVQSSGEFTGHETGDGTDSQLIRITHLGGDSVDIADTEIQVVTTCTDGERRGRLVGLPPDGNSLDGENIAGDDIFDESSFYSDRTVLRSDTTNILSAGKTIQFRITSGSCTVPTGETVHVAVIHTPSQAIIIEKDLTAAP